MIHDVEQERQSRQTQIDDEQKRIKEENELLRHRLMMREKEYHMIKKHAKALLLQRSEVETFFLQSIEEVRMEIKKKREMEYREKKMLYEAELRQLTLPKGAKFPAIKALDSQLMPAAPSPPRQKVDIKDLSSEEREKVLRLLFAKINGQQTTFSATLPPHSFNISVNPYASSAHSLRSNPILPSTPPPALPSHPLAQFSLMDEEPHSQSHALLLSAPHSSSNSQLNDMNHDPDMMSSYAMASRLHELDLHATDNKKDLTFLTNMKIDDGAS